MQSGLGELITDIHQADQQESVPLGTAQWMGLREAAHKFGMPPDSPSDRLWIGETLNDEATALGYGDDRHVTLVSGTRGGKGAGVIIPNLCLWRGSCIVIDPKGENATVTARRRGGGSEYTHGLGQEVRILDPFNEVPLPDTLKARFNPLDVIDPESDLAVDDAGRIAAAIIVRESKNDPFWEDAARGLVKGLILHVLTFRVFKDIRNLVTVRRLLMEGDWLVIEAGIEAGADPKKLPSPFTTLWQSMIRNKAFGGVVSGVGEQMLAMADKAEKTFSGVMEQARTSTIFLDGAPMRRLLEKSDFDLGAVKTSARGLTIYLTLPQRYMETHFRWLRLMVTLTLGEMERIKGRPKTGFPTLFLLDEFPGLKRMEVIENAVAQAAGFGVKFCFVTQNLPQLRREYDENWETFISNSGLKIFFQVDDHFSRDYLSNLLGEREVRRQSRSGSDSQSTSTTDGTSSTHTSGHSYTKGVTVTERGLFSDRGHESSSSGTSSSNSSGWSRSNSQSNSRTDGWSEGVHKRPLLSPDEIGRFLSRIDDKGNPAYPGLVLALTPGQHPLAATRINYFQSPKFEGCFDPHPDHPLPLTLAQLAARDASRRALPPPEPEIPPVGFLESLWRYLTEEHPAIGGAVVLGVIALVVIAAFNIPTSLGPVTLGPAVVVSQAEVDVWRCPGGGAKNCRVVAKLHKGDEVTVNNSFDNGMKMVTVRYTDGTSASGFVEGKFLRQK
jgi:type IV secretory pathway TraG/TraD family ATPase VirD4